MTHDKLKGRMDKLEDKLDKVRSLDDQLVVQQTEQCAPYPNMF
jgi:hypothetical protein